MNQNPKIGIIGAGNWGKNHVRVFEKLNVLKCVADNDEAIRNSIKRNYSNVAVTDKYTDILQDADINGVVIATPVSTHYRLVKEALFAGKDVLVEKPMALSINEAEELVGIAETKQRVIMVGHVLLYKPAVQILIETLREGSIGRLCYIEMRRAKLGKVRTGENVLWSFAPHDIALVLELTGKRVKEVYAHGQSILQTGIEDNVHLYLSFANNIQGHIHLSWLWPEDERKTVIVGTEGMLTYDENEGTILLYKKSINQELEIHDAGKERIELTTGDALENEANHFLHCIISRTNPVTDGYKGLEVVKILEAAGKQLDRLGEIGHNKNNNNKKVDNVNHGIVNAREYFAHTSAYIDDPVEIGRGSQIWHFCHIMSGAKIGENCKIGQNVFIGRNVVIGKNVKIQNNVSVYEGVILEDDVFCGPSCVFTNIKTPRSAYPRNTTEDYIKTIIKKGASIGANATIVCGTTIGEHALIGAGAVVTKDVPDFSIVVGNPAAISSWSCRCGKVYKYKSEILACICNEV